MNKRDQLEKELKHMHELFEAIEEAWNEKRIDENKDAVVPEWHADRISMLLGC